MGAQAGKEKTLLRETASEPDGRKRKREWHSAVAMQGKTSTKLPPHETRGDKVKIP